MLVIAIRSNVEQQVNNINNMERYPQLSVRGVRLCVHVTRTSNTYYHL